MKSGAIKNVGFRQMNSSVRPTHYLEKHYPIEGRKDFYKWVIVTPNGKAKDYKDEVMYFDEFDFEHARKVLQAIKRTARLDKQTLN